MKPINLREWEVRAIQSGATLLVRSIDRIPGLGKVTCFGGSETTGYDFALRDRRDMWHEFREDELLKRLPFGGPGEVLWGRETWVECIHTSPATDQPELCEGDKLIEHATQYTGADGEKRWHYNGRVICYRATSDVEFCDGDGFTGDMANRNDMPRWRPSTQMPLWASRFRLEVKAVRVMRVQELSEAEAIAAGMQSVGPPSLTDRGAFAKQWEKDRGKGAWKRNDWVAVCEFVKQETA